MRACGCHCVIGMNERGRGRDGGHVVVKWKRQEGGGVLPHCCC